MAIFTFTVVQKYRGIPVFWRVSKPEKLQADRLWCGTVRAPQSAIHQLHDKCHTRLEQPLFCPTCNRIVSRDEVAQVIDMMDALKKSLRETVRTGKRPRVAGERAAARNAKRLAS